MSLAQIIEVQNNMIFVLINNFIHNHTVIKILCIATQVHAYNFFPCFIVKQRIVEFIVFFFERLLHESNLSKFIGTLLVRSPCNIVRKISGHVTYEIIVSVL